MLTIIACGLEPGYDPDHLNDSRDARRAVGRTARTLPGALQIVRRASKSGNRAGSPVWVQCRNDRGDLVEGAEKDPE